jgi:hypothetical protein
MNNIECYGCGQSFDQMHEDAIRVGVRYYGKHRETTSDETYCPKCSLKIEDMDHDLIHDQFEELVKTAITKGPPKTTVTISESLVREIAKNLGASYKLADALVERIFGRNWTGAPPEDSGIVMNKYANRDRLVAFVAAKLQDLWRFEA